LISVFFVRSGKIQSQIKNTYSQIFIVPNQEKEYNIGKVNQEIELHDSGINQKIIFFIN
jgi:hypothetical protein